MGGILSYLIIISSCFSYYLGKQSKNELLSKHGQLYGKLTLIHELGDLLGHKILTGEEGKFDIIETYHLKDITYFVINKNGVKTLAVYEYRQPKS